jgi:hypothetical protein
MTPEEIAKELCSVQPMPSDIMKKVLEASDDENTLAKDGYRPVSSLGLMWAKDK